MESLSDFAAAHPEFCDPRTVRVPGHGQLPPVAGARPFELTSENLSHYRVEAAKDPGALPAMLKLGPEAVAFYVSFRLAPERWGVYIREGGLRALKEEYHRIIWRDLGKYADKNVDDVADKVETTLVLDYLLAHNRVHFIIDRWAAEQEATDGKARYAAYQAAWYIAPPKPAMVPEDVGNLEEALANMEAFRQYINPSYAEGVAKRSEEHTSELQSHSDLVCRLLLEKKKCADSLRAGRCRIETGPSRRCWSGLLRLRERPARCSGGRRIRRRSGSFRESRKTAAAEKR